MFDEELHKETYSALPAQMLLPPDEVSPLDLEGKLQLEYYKLQKTFAGSIELEQVKGVYEPAKKGAMGLDTKSTLDEIIAKINEKYKGEFTEGDKVLLAALRSRLDGRTRSDQDGAEPQIRRFLWKAFPPRPSEQRSSGQLSGIAGYIYLAFLRISTSIMP